ncbi:hypothetical protein ACQQ96_08840, partial [Lactobacillus johnsonii]|uniref:hypothetical protein n=1 Tax=Lactobacillus johnsonii TaxID=33959 RepID=UPI003D038B8C
DIKSSSGSEATAALDVTAFNQAAIARAFGTSLRAVVNSSVDQGTNVTTWAEFTHAINNGDKLINIENNLDLEDSNFSIDHDVTINANHHELYANNSIFYLYGSSADPNVNVTVENADIYGTSTANTPTFYMGGNGDGNVNLTLDNINFTGGTFVESDIDDSLQHEFNLTFEGVNTVTAGEYNDTVTKQTAGYFNMGGATAQLYVDNGVKVAKGASLIMDAKDSVDYNIIEMGLKYSHSFIVDEDAKVTMTAPTGNVLTYNGAFGTDLDLSNFSHDSTFTINPSATVKLTTTQNGSSNGQGNIVIKGDTSLNHTATINIDKDAKVTMSAARNSSNIISNAQITTVNINDPDSVVLMNHGGQAYTAIGTYTDGSSIKPCSINVSTNNAKVTITNTNNDSISSSVLDSNVTKYQSDHKVDPGDTTPANKKVLDSIANSNITNVTYIGKTKI